ncbi:hypothetical protein NL676_038262 [Syzygium grande]|nr:hypothetical protein NL676_038262 [Syzygium grande]
MVRAHPSSLGATCSLRRATNYGTRGAARRSLALTREPAHPEGPELSPDQDRPLRPLVDVRHRRVRAIRRRRCIGPVGDRFSSRCQFVRGASIVVEFQE